MAKFVAAVSSIIAMATAAFSALPSQAPGRGNTPKTAVYLECPAKDTVGQSLCSRVREEIRKSVGFELVPTLDEAFVRARIHTVDKDTPPLGAASAVAVILTFAKGDGYLHDQVWYVGAKTVDTAAVGIVSGIDSYLDELFKAARRGRGSGQLSP